jgi:serine/threonine-protein kinase
MTSTAAVIGTAQYLSPEQARGEGVDARSDVYSLGCLLYELVTGAPPFTGDSPVAVAYQHVREDPRLPSSINREVPPELDAILLKAMSKNPANRYQSAADMRNDLLRALAGQRVEATPVMGDVEKTTILAATPGGYGYADDRGWDDEDEEARRRKRRLLIIWGLVALLLVAGAISVAIALSGGGKPASTPPAQVPVPLLLGKSQADAEQALTGAGLVVGTVTQQTTDNAGDVGKVLASDPASGAQVSRGSKVGLTVGQAPDTVAVPPVVGLDVAGAKTTLTSAGFTSITTDHVDSAKPKGTVISVDPAQGTQVAKTQSITLSVSDGNIAIPDVHGKSQADAEKALKDAGFTSVSVQSVENDSVPQGSAVGTEPGAGTPATADTTITLLIAVPTPPAASTTPTNPPTTPPTTSAPATASSGG